jgi:hypothetical protein
LLLVRRVAGEDGRAGLHGRGDVPEALHGGKFASAELGVVSVNSNIGRNCGT